MTYEIRRWGNSLALRIPKDLTQTLGLDEGSKVEMILEDGRLIITPKQARLNTLLNALETYGQSDPHGELDWDEDVGGERL
jgi:antitoxin MazE